jgi:glutamate racemase
VGVVRPGAEAAVEASARGEIGVIGTAGTVKSGAYERALHAIDPSVQVTARACPLFVPLVEEGWLDSEPTRLIAREYLEPLAAAHIDTLVLGCTHYPLLKPLLAEVLGPGVRLIDSAEKTAEQIGRQLRERGQEAEPDARPTYRFIASDAPEQFLRVGQQFLGAAIDHVETVTLG